MLVIRKFGSFDQVDGCITQELKTMRHLSLFLFATFFILFAGVLRSEAQLMSGTDSGLGGQNRVTGMVLAPDGQRILRRLPVKLVTQGRGERIASTDDNGSFLFTGLIAGDYTILIDKEQEFETYAYPITIRQRRGFPPESVMVNIRLSFRKGASQKPAVINVQYANVPQPALDMFNKAVELGRKGDRKGAIDHLEKAVAAYDKFTDAYNDMGVHYLALGDLANAAGAFQSALRIDQTAYSPMMNLGMTLFTMKKYPEADPVIRAALAMNDKAALPHYFLGQNSAYLGKFDEADKELNEALKLGGAEMVEAHRLLAIIYGSRGDKNKSANELEAYLKINPKAADAPALKKRVEELRKQP
jgi:tetratricopeptide (TPR) repeat protein